MTIPNFDVALEVSKLKSDPAKAANPAKVEGRLATLATLAGGAPRFEAFPPPIQISNFSNFSSPSPSKGQRLAIPIPTGPDPKGTGLEWIVWPADDADPDFDAKWAAFDLADLAKLYGLRIVHTSERIIAVYPPALEPELVAYASELLAEAQDFLRQHIDRLPILPPAEAVTTIKAIMRQHPGLRFCRGEGGSRWPLYPREWTAGQRVTVQALWFAAGEALDQDDFHSEVLSNKNTSGERYDSK